MLLKEKPGVIGIEYTHIENQNRYFITCLL